LIIISIHEEYYLLGYNAVQSVESQPTLATCFHDGFLIGLFFDPEDGGDVLPKCQLTFNGLHGVISQKIASS
jgi:hypothetical protein